MTADDSATERLRRVELLMLDVDGVLTNGHIQFDHEGRETKSFHVHDAAGLIYWHRCGGETGFLSGRSGPIVEHRARDLGITEVHLGHLDKLPVLDEVLGRRGLQPEQIAYVGDDLLDLPCLRKAGFSFAPADARPEVRSEVDHVTSHLGGQGVVREVVELLLRARGVWDRVVERGGRP